MLRIDVHQHLLGEPLIAALARRRAAPTVVREQGGWTLRLEGEPDSLLAFADADPHARREELERDGVDVALVALSSALGSVALPAAQAVPLLDIPARSPSGAIAGAPATAARQRRRPGGRR
jgi:hypothetical protein